MLRSRARLVSGLSALVLALAGGIVLAVGMAPAAGAADPVPAAGAAEPATSGRGGGGGHRPVGYWTGTATTATGMTEPVQMRFAPRDRLVVVTPTGTFTGTWRSTGPKTFRFAFVRSLPGPDGSVIGTIDIRHTALFTDRNSFTSTGTATGHDLNGNLLFSGPVSSTATR